MDDSLGANEATAPLPRPSGVVWPVEEVSLPRPFLASRRLLAILVALCLALSAVSAYAWYRSRDAVAVTAPVGVITSVRARDTALQAATALTRQVLSYNWRTLDADLAASEAVLAPGFRGEYAKAMSKVRDQTIQNQVKLTADVVATSIISASEERVEALVFVNQITTAKGTGTRRLDQNRVRVTLTPAGGDWRVSKMDSF